MSIHHLAYEAQAYLFENALNAAGDAILITDTLSGAEGGPHIIFANDAFYETTGFSKEEVLGKTPRILQGKDTDKEALKRIAKALELRKTIREELINYRKNGTPFYLELVITPIKNPQGVVTHFISVQRDITERKQKEEAIRTQKVLEELLNFRLLLFKKLNHELRNPLNGIIATIEMLLQEKMLLQYPETYRRIEILLQASKQIQNILQKNIQIQDNYTDLPVHFSLFPIKVIINQVVSLFEPIAHKQNKHFSLTFSNGVPENINSDEVKFIQIFSNLLHNSIKYSTGNLIQIAVSYQQDFLKVEIYNDSTPFEEDDIHKLFMPFSRLSNKDDGMGLGLTIAKQLTEQLEGEISIVPQKRGNTFYFTIKNHPLLIKSFPSPIDLSSCLEDIRAKKYKVLLADDHDLSRRVSKMLLEYFGCQVVECKSGEEVLQNPDIMSYHMILLDIVMPELNGIQTLQALRQKYVSLPPVIGVSANILPAQVKTYLEKGFSGFLEKPLQKNKVLEFLVKLNVSPFHQSQLN
ncbi:MAG: PAS domain-containing protein [Cytophagales bacterium]|nr:PAS domain-containing protein [Cytophagales bacterium]MDW8384173.1 PAS domain-containing protein [Flammeovirgaceae bacterium]